AGGVELARDGEVDGGGRAAHELGVEREPRGHDLAVQAVEPRRGDPQEPRDERGEDEREDGGLGPGHGRPTSSSRARPRRRPPRRERGSSWTGITASDAASTVS